MVLFGRVFKSYDVRGRFVDVPGPCRNLRVDNVTSSDMTLSWEAPADDGGSLVTGYYVEKRQGYSNR